MNNIIICEYPKYRSDDILPLYQSVGWANYTNSPLMLEQAFCNSLKILAAYDKEKVVGIIRAVGDGFSMVYIQDILIYPEYQRRGIGTALLNKILELYQQVYQKVLMTDNTPKTLAFYESLEFHLASDYGCATFLKTD